MTEQERNLECQLLAVASRYKKQRGHRGVIHDLMKPLSDRLSDAGFVLASKLMEDVHVDGDRGCYEATAHRQWRHPDGRKRFDVLLALRVQTRAARCGEVSVELVLRDENLQRKTPGVLFRKPFRDRVELQPAANIDSAEDWEAWTSKGLSLLHPEALYPLFDQAMVHLEAAAAP